MLLKRALDLTLSVLLLVILSPLLAAIAFAVWRGSGRPILYAQERVGRDFHRFPILKFRTMRPAGGPSITVTGDHRVTRVGKLLRAAKLDELPQFWNVLRGDMSIVGPRPEVSEYVELFRDRYRSVLTVRPGITDLASLRFRREEEILSGSSEPLQEYVERILPDKLDLADEYIRTRTFCGDLWILFRTVASIVKT